jgi:cytochrome c oxidase assembly protein subunit 15
MNQLCVDQFGREAAGLENHRKAVGLWLLIMAGMILVNVLLGGLTRLTGSGLSMVEWQPLSVLPPMTDGAWADMFAKYQQSPQFREVNAQMDLAGFKGIFWLEFIHRNWGRLLGFAFFIPFVVFLVKKFITKAEVPAFALLFALGAGQGVLGWAMVASGLRDRPEVSHYRLAAHLFAALLLYAALLWTGFNRLEKPEAHPLNKGLRSAKRHLRIILILLCITIPAGALVAGLHAGLVYNTFPLMGDDLVAPDAFDLSPGWLNFFANPSLVQFDHRVLALFTWTTAMGLIPAVFRAQLIPASLRKKIGLVVVLANLQVLLGVSTLLFYVPIPLAAIHQLTAFLLFGATLWSFHQIRQTIQ